ncbi:MAG: ZIP family metal transporter [Candidatus Omnitrophica bacterium]|nr:ZIP family metal transporter [Candidatus Omnitrophota bacterium]
MNVIWALGASVVVSLISLIGIFGLLMKQEALNKILILLVGISGGAWMGGAFLHLVPEALEKSGSEQVFLLLIAGFIVFFIMERYLHWRRHTHDVAYQDASLGCMKSATCLAYNILLVHKKVSYLS